MAVISGGRIIGQGSGLMKPDMVIEFAGAPVNGVSGTAVGAPKGTLLKDTTNGLLYQNTNTAASPTWTKVGTQT